MRAAETSRLSVPSSDRPFQLAFGQRRAARPLANGRAKIAGLEQTGSGKEYERGPAWRSAARKFEFDVPDLHNLAFRRISVPLVGQAVENAVAARAVAVAIAGGLGCACPRSDARSAGAEICLRAVRDDRR